MTSRASRQNSSGRQGRAGRQRRDKRRKGHINSRLRLTMVGVVVMSLFAALFTRLWYLQVLDSPQFVEAAKRNQVRYVCESAPRGLIRDRNGTVLVDNQVITALTVSRKYLSDHKDTLVPRLAALLGITPEQLQQRVDNKKYSDLKPVPFAFDGPDGDLASKIVRIKEHAEDFPGVEAAAEATRAYPAGRVASHVLGTVGPIVQAELDARTKVVNRTDGQVDPFTECERYRATDDVGKTGVESSFEQELRGVAGIVAYEVDSKGRILREDRKQLPQQGHDVWLTIDLDLQRETEASLRKGLVAAQQLRFSKLDPSFLHAPGGAAVVTDVTTGAVLALASYPDFNPQDFVGGISTKDYAAYNDDPRHPLQNRAISGLYPPASTFKLPTSIAAVRTGLIAPTDTYVDTGKYTVEGQCSGGCVKQNAGAVGHGRVNLTQAITVSSDTFYYRLGDKFWQQSHTAIPVQDTARELGLGKKTGIRIANEKEGIVGDPFVRKRIFDRQPGAYATDAWYAGDNLNMAIGQGETVATPLQLAREYATFANGGTLFESRIASKTANADGSTATELAPVVLGQANIPQNAHDAILAGMRGVVASPGGTAYDAFRGYGGLAAAGKTGTAQRKPEQDYAVFCGFAPYNAPQYSVAIVLEEGGFGGKTAAPVARQIFEKLSGQAPGEITIQQDGGTD